MSKCVAWQSIRHRPTQRQYPVLELGWRSNGYFVWPNCTLRMVRAQARVLRGQRRIVEDRQFESDLSDFLGIVQTVGAALLRSLHPELAAELELEAPGTLEAQFRAAVQDASKSRQEGQ